MTYNIYITKQEPDLITAKVQFNGLWYKASERISDEVKRFNKEEERKRALINSCKSRVILELIKQQHGDENDGDLWLEIEKNNEFRVNERFS